MFRSCVSRSLVRALLLAVSLVGVASPVRADKVSVLVPAYFYPTWWSGSPWDELNAAAAKIPIEAIMNPGSGPGSRVNPDYQVAVGELQTAGGKVIGYVATGYGSRTDRTPSWPTSRRTSTWYNVDGIFLDEMGNQDGSLDYVALYNAIKALTAGSRGSLHVVGNPGTPFPWVQSYLAAADTLNIFEGPLTNSDPNGASFKLYPTRGPYAELPCPSGSRMSIRPRSRTSFTVSRRIWPRA